MPNPFNPLEWMRSAQDWFSRTERSSGFRPYLVFLILCYGVGVLLLFMFGEIEAIRTLALQIIGWPTAAFVVVYLIKAFVDPDFCRSERHIQKMTQMKIEKLGTESELIDAQVVQAELSQHSQPDTEIQRLSGETGDTT